VSPTGNQRKPVTPDSVKVLMLVEAGIILFLTYWVASEYTYNSFFRTYVDQVLMIRIAGYSAILELGIGIAASAAAFALYEFLRKAKLRLETTAMPRIRGGVEKMITVLPRGDAGSPPSVGVAVEPKVSTVPGQPVSSPVTMVPVPEKIEPKKDAS
jgi:hypothetical protein